MLMNSKHIGQFCDILIDQMEIKPRDKYQSDNFKKQMRKYAGKTEFVALNELFKLCTKLHLELEKRPTHIEPVGDSIPDKLDHYEKLIQGFPDRYTKLRHMREFDDTSTEIDDYLDVVEEDDDYGERADEIRAYLINAHDEIVETFGVEVFEPKTLGDNKPSTTWVYSPQSYADYLSTLNDLIKDFPNSRQLSQYKQEILDNIEIKEILQENQ